MDRDCYLGIERNRDTGEESFPGEFLHEPRKVQGRRSRKGFHTGHRTKVEACLNAKRLIEQDKITINSRPLLSELKNFVAKGNSFSAKPGEHDDLVMSMMLCIRMIHHISTFEDEVFDAVNSNLVNPNDYGDYDREWDDQDEDGPMPLGIL